MLRSRCLYSGTVTASASTLAAGTQVSNFDIATRSPAKRATNENRQARSESPSRAYQAVQLRWSIPRKFTRTPVRQLSWKKLRREPTHRPLGNHRRSIKHPCRSHPEEGQSQSRRNKTHRSDLRAFATRQSSTYADPHAHPWSHFLEAATSLSAVAGDEQGPRCPWIAPWQMQGPTNPRLRTHYTKDGSTWFPWNDPISPSTSSIVTGLANGDNTGPELSP